MQAGRIIEQGSHDELMRNPTGAYAQLVHVREHEPPKVAEEDEAGGAKVPHQAFMSVSPMASVMADLLVHALLMRCRDVLGIVLHGENCQGEL